MAKIKKIELNGVDYDLDSAVTGKLPADVYFDSIEPGVYYGDNVRFYKSEGDTKSVSLTNIVCAFILEKVTESTPASSTHIIARVFSISSSRTDLLTSDFYVKTDGTVSKTTYLLSNLIVPTSGTSQNIAARFTFNVLPRTDNTTIAPSNDAELVYKKYVDDLVANNTKVHYITDATQQNPFIFEDHELGVYVFSSNSYVKGLRGSSEVQSLASLLGDTYSIPYVEYHTKISTESEDYTRFANSKFIGFDGLTLKLEDLMFQISSPASISTSNITVAEAGGQLTIVTTEHAQTISGKKTFTTLPESSVVPTNDNDLVNKKYVDDNTFSGDYEDLTNTPDLSEYVKDTNYAGSTKAGVIRVNGNLGLSIDTSNGNLKTSVKNYEQYSSMTDNGFIGKGTLENVISGKGLQIQMSTMPTASADNLGRVVQYIGTTDSTYTSGYFYLCVSDGEETPTYSWEEVEVQAGSGASYTAGTNIDITNDVISSTIPYKAGSSNGLLLGNTTSSSISSGIGIGSGATASGGSVTIGQEASTGDSDEVAVGNRAKVGWGARGVAIGHQTEVGGNHRGSIAIGYCAKTTKSGQVMFGANGYGYGYINEIAMTTSNGVKIVATEDYVDEADTILYDKVLDRTYEDITLVTFFEPTPADMGDLDEEDMYTILNLLDILIERTDTSMFESDTTVVYPIRVLLKDNFNYAFGTIRLDYDYQNERFWAFSISLRPEGNLLDISSTITYENDEMSIEPKYNYEDNSMKYIFDILSRLDPDLREYSAEGVTYNPGDCVIYDYGIYRCTDEAGNEDFDYGKWESISIKEYILGDVEAVLATLTTP